MNKVSHVCFSDESNWNVGQYRSIGMISLPIGSLEPLESELASLLRPAPFSEFKWADVKGAHIKSIAEQMCDFAIKYCTMSQLRVDVLIWNIQDERHTVKRRDDEKNLNIMYFHLLRNVFRERWPDATAWLLYPDESNILDGTTLQECLENARIQIDFLDHSLFDERDSFRILYEYGPTEIRTSRSNDYALLQLADLFAGLAAFSYKEYSRYEEWKKLKGTIPMFPEDAENGVNPSKFTNREKYRFDLLYNFHHKCMNRKFTVSLKEENGLYTFMPDRRMNFWLYKREHAKDKAPVKERNAYVG